MLIEEDRLIIEDQDQNEVENEIQDEEEFKNQNIEEGNGDRDYLKDHNMNTSKDEHDEEEV